MTDGRDYDVPAVYQIRVKGKLDQKWVTWFDGFIVTPLTNEETMLTGLVADQAALHGLLAKIRDLGLPLLLVIREKQRRENTIGIEIQEFIRRLKKKLSGDPRPTQRKVLIGAS